MMIGICVFLVLFGSFFGEGFVRSQAIDIKCQLTTFVLFNCLNK